MEKLREWGKEGAVKGEEKAEGVRKLDCDRECAGSHQLKAATCGLAEFAARRCLTQPRRGVTATSTATGESGIFR
jgi:hypothetical protein